MVAAPTNARPARKTAPKKVEDKEPIKVEEASTEPTPSETRIVITREGLMSNGRFYKLNEEVVTTDEWASFSEEAQMDLLGAVFFRKV